MHLTAAVVGAPHPGLLRHRRWREAGRPGEPRPYLVVCLSASLMYISFFFRSLCVSLLLYFPASFSVSPPLFPLLFFFVSLRLRCGVGLGWVGLGRVVLCCVVLDNPSLVPPRSVFLCCLIHMRPQFLVGRLVYHMRPKALARVVMKLVHPRLQCVVLW